MRKNKQNEIIGTILALILLIVLVFLTSVSNDGKGYFQNLLDRLTYPVKHINFNLSNKKQKPEGFSSIKEMQEELDNLLLENNKLKTELEVKNVLLEDNKKLSELLNLKNQYKEFETVPVKIKYRSTNNFSDYVIINSGKDQGIEEDMVVISESGLYGRVEEVYEKEAKVKSITDPSSKVSVVAGKKNESLIAQGSIKPGAKLIATLIPEEYNLSVGELVYTSGIGGLFPKGIFVGTISETSNMGNISDRQAVIKIPKDFDEAQNLLVIKKQN